VVHFEASFPCHALHLALKVGICPRMWMYACVYRHAQFDVCMNVRFHKACDVARETRLRFSGTSAPLSLDDTAAPASSFAAAAAGAGGDGTVGGVGGLDGGRTARGGPALIQHQVSPMLPSAHNKNAIEYNRMHLPYIHDMARIETVCMYLQRCMHIVMWPLNVYTCIFYVCMYACMYICMYVCIYV
jgi:hypothetical protein